VSVNQSGGSVLRTIAPALSKLGTLLNEWLAGRHTVDLAIVAEVELNTLLDDLSRQAEALGGERILLNIVFMGGTGVGKSTLLNALAGGCIAEASNSRPTTRQPVVYCHHSVGAEHLEPPLRNCRVTTHDRSALEHKVLVDTPDLDSNELANRERLKEILPVADIVLYVGSQEKYHDHGGWDLFQSHRPRREFAFVLNKWDRCQHGLQGGGVRPDEDWLADLRRAGIHEPRLFRTCAQLWAAAPGSEPSLPEGEQFRELVSWLEDHLTEREIEAIKAKGVSQLLDRLEGALERLRPKDLDAAAEHIRRKWKTILQQEAAARANLFLADLDVHCHWIERLFASALYRQFRGIAGCLLQGVAFLRAFLDLSGSLFQGRIGQTVINSAAKGDSEDVRAAWVLPMALAAERQVDARGRALRDQLLIEARQESFPLNPRWPEMDQAGEQDQPRRYRAAVEQTIEEVKSQWTGRNSSGSWVLRPLIWLDEWGSLAALVVGLLIALNTLIPVLPLWESVRNRSLWEILALPLILVAIMVALVSILVRVLLPVRWTRIRDMFSKRLSEQFARELEGIYLDLPRRVAEQVREERRQVDRLIEQVREIRGRL
jgi:energy-coupling factor transporter ATP-binding protein EcfA2